MATASDIYTSTASYLEAARATAVNAISDLENTASQWNITQWRDVGAPVTGEYSPAFEDTDITIKAALNNFNTTISGLNLGDLPDFPIFANYTMPVWNESSWTDLKSLLGIFTSSITGADGVDSVVIKLASETERLQVALFNQERERRLQTLADITRVANSMTGDRGFSYPNSMTVALRLASQQQHMMDLSQVARDLISRVFEWAKSNYQFSIQQQLAAHGADVDFNIRYAAMLIQAFDTEIKAALEIYKDKIIAETGKMEAAIKAYAIRLEALKTQESISIERDRNDISIYQQEIQQHISNVKMAIDTAASTAQNKINAAAQVVKSASDMVASAQMIAVGTLTQP